MTTDNPKTYERKQLNITVTENEFHLLVHCEFCQGVIATIDKRVLPNVALNAIVLGSLNAHLHQTG